MNDFEVVMVGAGAAGLFCAGVAGQLGPLSYAGEYKAALRYADGDKDPATGQCRGISTTYKVTAVRALIPNGSAATRMTRIASANSGSSIGR